MRIGLIRHFKVKLGPPRNKFVTRDELLIWFEDYDTADIVEGAVDLGGVSWERCYASDLPRALQTAAAIYKDPIIPLPGLGELQPLLLFKRNFKLPFLLWVILCRIKQLISKRSMNDFIKRITASLDEIISQSDKDTLIVSHGFVMMFLRKELKKRGFNGAAFNHPVHGKLYLFEK